MATGTLQQSGDVTAQIEQLITTLGGTPVTDGMTGLLKQLNSALASSNAPGTTLPLAPAGATSETFARVAGGAQSVTIAVASGTLQLAAVYLPINTIVNAINFVTGTTGSTGVSHNWAVLADSSRKVLAVSPDNTVADLAASTLQTYTFAAPFTTTYSGLYYVGFMISTGTTQPTMIGNTAAGSTLNNIAPKVSGASNVGATVPVAVAATLTAITASASTLYAFTT